MTRYSCLYVAAVHLVCLVFGFDKAPSSSSVCLQRAIPLVYRPTTFDERMDVHLNKVLDFLLAKRA